jgi:hypothetical protein
VAAGSSGGLSQLASLAVDAAATTPARAGAALAAALVETVSIMLATAVTAIKTRKRIEIAPPHAVDMLPIAGWATGTSGATIDPSSGT